AEKPINLIRNRIVARDQPVLLRREPYLPVSKGDSVGSPQSAKIDPADFFPCHQIHHGNRVTRSACAVVGNKRHLAVIGNGDFVRSFAGGNLRDRLECAWIDDRERGLFLIQNEEGGRRSLRSREMRLK